MGSVAKITSRYGQTRRLSFRHLEQPGDEGGLSAHIVATHVLNLSLPDHLPATQYRAARTQAFQTWAEVTGVARLA